MNYGNSNLSARAAHSIKSQPGQRPKLSGFVFTERLGSGTYATVYKAYKKSTERREVHAIKCIRKSSLNRTSMENLLVEIEILKQIDHPHIVKMLDFQWDSSFIYIIMEYCGGGDLSKFINTRRMLPEYVVRRFLQQIASALQLLHDHSISHMDLKPQNILLTSEEQPVLKLADFGFAQFLDSSENDALKGSPLYMAPEIITQRRYSAKVDLWSIGVILYECLFGRAPFASNSFVELENKIKSDKPIELPGYPQISDECSALLYSLLQRDPDDRISFEDFFLHSFVDLEHKPSAECLVKATNIVTKAVAKDKEGKKEEALKLYNEAIEYFVPAIYHETNRSKKDALRHKVKEYVSRAEQLRSPSLNGSTASDQTSLIQLSQHRNEIGAALNSLQEAFEKETNGNLQESMVLYEKSLETLISLSSEEKDAQLKKFLRNEIETYLKRAESLREKLKTAQPKENPNPGTSGERKVKLLRGFSEEEESMKTKIFHWTVIVFVSFLISGLLMQLGDTWTSVSTMVRKFMT